ncbi:P-loop containing nucleoside triphosphate hydrolase protein [Hygrophoropsis aurantiaca]|uniref:P-loop containing nucleoside triphosphate hydrolase protein n=1 Tax=Hygrophoropsis aurantiaca TaxID=72124 RepID=A0ACB7ZPC9_9AGAM|nr:P-loop containing nucleoside triphosphate hydrolase protein [Hygrophoropsis aurantiaca]
MDEVRRCRWSVSLWSPEKLTSSGADAVIRDETFRRNLALYGVDETHVVYIWGASFRAAYRQIGLVHKRLPKHVPLVAVTATLVPGAEQNELTHGLGGDTFPDIAWVLDAGEKVVLYCKTIELAFRVALYLWSLCPAGPARRMKAVRLWYSLTSSTYNAETLDLFTNDPDTCAIVATVAFGLGMNQRNIWKVVNVGLQDSLSPIIQQDGRAGRCRS